MIYSVVWLQITPGNLEKGTAHLQKLTQLIQADFGLKARVLTSLTSGPVYRVGLVAAYENMSAAVKLGDALAGSKNFQDWFAASAELFAWASAERQTFRTQRASGTFDSDFIHTVVIHITPGQLQAGREMLAKLADHYESTYSRPAEVLSLEGGLHYRHYMVVGYDSMEQYEEVQTAVASDKAYGQWTVDMMGMFDNTTVDLERRLCFCADHDMETSLRHLKHVRPFKGPNRSIHFPLPSLNNSSKLRVRVRLHQPKSRIRFSSLDSLKIIIRHDNLPVSYQAV